MVLEIFGFLWAILKFLEWIFNRGLTFVSFRMEKKNNADGCNVRKEP
jgi:hypothetical protein